MTHPTRLSRAFSLLVLFVLVFTSFSTTHAQAGVPGDQPTATPPAAGAPATEATPAPAAAPEEQVTVVPAAPAQHAAVIFSIAGKVSGKDGKGLAGVTLSDDQGHQVLSGADGAYALGGLKAGMYIVRASLAGVELIPFYRVVRLVDKDLSGIDFYPPKNPAPARPNGARRQPNAPANPAPAGNPGDLAAQAAYKAGAPGTAYRYLSEFGTLGQPYLVELVGSITHLNQPAGIAIDANGKLLEVEAAGNRLVRFNPSGVSDLAIGHAGITYTGQYVFNRLTDVAVDPTGDIWVLDVNRVVKYDPTRAEGDQYLLESPVDSPWNMSDVGHFNNPLGITFNPSGSEMYVADTNNQRVQVFTFDGDGKPQFDRILDSTDDGVHFSSPAKVIYYNGDLYVTDSGNQRIVRCPAAAAPCEPWLGETGVSGSDFTHLNWPSGVTFGSSYAYVADGGNARVLRCGLDGTGCTHFAGVAGEFGQDDSHFNWISAIAVDTGGKVYVDDQGNERIQVFDDSGALVGTRGVSWEPYQTDSHHLNGPRGVAAAADGSLYVTEANNDTLTKLNAAGVVQWRFGENGHVTGTDLDHISPTGNPAIDSQGRIYVADPNWNHVVILLPNGTIYGILGDQFGWGSGNNQFNWPQGVAISPVNGDIYVADTSNSRIQVYDSSRNYKATLGETGVPGSDSRHFSSPWGVAVDGRGNIYVVDHDNQRVQKCNLDGAGGYTCTPFAGQTGVQGMDFRNLNYPTAVAVGPDGKVYVTDSGLNRVQVFAGDGSYLTTLGGDWGADSGRLKQPDGVAVDADGNVYVTDEWNARVVKYAPGVPGWSQVNVNGFGEQSNGRASPLISVSIEGTEYIYSATINTSGASGAARVWRRDSAGKWQAVSAAGFGDPNNFQIIDMAQYKNYLYADTFNWNGAQIWRCSLYSGCDQDADWQQVTPSGLDPHNTIFNALQVFDTVLYVGTANWYKDGGVDKTDGGEIWEFDGNNWSSGPILKLDAATAGSAVTDIQAMVEFDGHLLAGTIDWVNGNSAQLWSYDGSAWNRLRTNGITDGNNTSLFSLVAFKGNLYTGTGNDANGAMIYRYSPEWSGDEVVMSGGFGDANNVAVCGLAADTNTIYAVTENKQTGLQIWRSANGSDWNKFLGTDGFGSSLNTQADRSSSLLLADDRLYVGAWNGFNGGGVWASDPITSYTVSGTIAAGGAGVTVTLNPGGRTATTDSNGYYEFTGVFPGVYTLTPAKPFYAFTLTSPAAQPVTVSTADVEVDFSATSGPVNLLSPADGMQLDSLLPLTLSWAPITGANKYTLQVSTAPGFGTLWKNVTQAGTTYVVSGMAAKTTYYWRVRQAALSVGNWSAMWSFTTPWPAAAPVQLLPLSNAVLALNDTTPDFTWKAAVPPAGAPSVRQYQLQISQSSAFAGLDLDEYTRDAGLAYTPPTGLTPNRVYYWRIRAVNTADEFSAWSPVRMFKTLPGPVGLDWIENQDTLQPTFHWHDDGRVGAYTIQICKGSNAACTLFKTAAVSGTSFALTSSLVPGQIYTWRVQAVGVAGPGPFSDFAQWNAATPPATPGLTTPLANEVIPDANFLDYFPMLTWQPVAGASSYQVQAAMTTAFTGEALWLDRPSVKNAFYKLDVPIYSNSTSYWRVRACGSGGCSLWAAPRKLVARASQPDTLQAWSDHDLNYFFSWHDSALNTASSFTVQICKVASCAALFKTASVTGRAYSLTLPGGTALWWRVQGSGPSGVTGSWSAIQPLPIIAPPAAPALTAPANNAVTAYTVNFAWKASAGPASDQYDIQVSQAADFSSQAAEDNPGSPSDSFSFAAGSYYWRVRAGNSDGWSLWSASRKFLTPAEVAGYVVKTDGTPIAGATVTLNGVNAPATGSDGWYDFKNAPVGARSLSVSAPGFMPQARSLSLANGSYYRNDFGLVTPGSSFTIQLTWADKPGYPDLDAHLWLPDGTHLSWQNPGPAGGASLDIHDGTPPRVETISIKWPDNVGTYTLGVYQWYPLTGALGSSGATIRVYLGGSMALNVCPVPASGSGRWWAALTLAKTADGIVTTRCVGKIQSTPPGPVEATFYKESPALASLVSAGKLPPVDQRVSKNPEVITPRESIGSYGGTLKTFSWWQDIGNVLMYISDPPIKWNADLSGYKANLADRWSWSADGKTFTMHLREGVKWSDGTPYTTEDWRFWWQDMATNPAYPAANVPDWLRQSDGLPLVMEFPDAYTVVWKSDKPLWVTPYFMAQGFWEFASGMMKPASFLKKFHPKYTPGETYADLQNADQWWKTPGYPTVFAWYCASVSSDGNLVTFGRNPYFWKVDSQGHQLPYIDNISVEVVTDAQTQLLNASQGKYDTVFASQFTPQDIPFLQARQASGNYTLLSNFMQGTGGWPAYTVNQDYVAGGGNYSADSDAMAAQYRAVLRDKRFRQALSTGIDRAQVIQAAWNGSGTPQGATLSPQSPLFAGAQGQNVLHQWQQAYATLDIAGANARLDAMGMTLDGDGNRTLPDTHDPFVLTIDVSGNFPVDWNSAQEVARQWRENLHLNVAIKDYRADSGTASQRVQNGLDMLSSAQISEMDIWTVPDWFFPVNSSSHAFPLEGLWYQSHGSQGEQPQDGSPAKLLQALYDQGMAAPQDSDRTQIVWQAIQNIYIDEGPFIIGISGDQPAPVLAKNTMHNVLNAGVIGPWAPAAPGNQDPSEWWMDAH